MPKDKSIRLMNKNHVYSLKSKGTVIDTSVRFLRVRACVRVCVHESVQPREQNNNNLRAAPDKAGEQRPRLRGGSCGCGR